MNYIKTKHEIIERLKTGESVEEIHKDYSDFPIDLIFEWQEEILKPKVKPEIPIEVQTNLDITQENSIIETMRFNLSKFGLSIITEARCSINSTIDLERLEVAANIYSKLHNCTKNDSIKNIVNIQNNLSSSELRFFDENLKD